MKDAQVIVIGAGPVGLCLALDLAWRGIRVIIVEQRRAGDPPSVKCNHIAARTMEAFRRLGLVEEIRSLGLPDDYPNDVNVRVTATGPVLTRIHIPCRRDRYTDHSGPDGWWPTPEPAHRVNQTYFEPVLFARASAHPLIEIVNDTRVEAIEQDADGVTVHAISLDGTAQRTFRAPFAVGCDGGRSLTRKSIGGSLTGDEVVQRVQSSHILAPGLLERMERPYPWMSYLYTPDRAGNLVAIDGREQWLVHNYLLPGEEGFETVDRDACIRHLLGVDRDFEYTLLAKEDWIGRRLVADRLRQGRVFIAGDAAHLWVPYAGYGMNAGIADALDLSWMLAAHLHGWAPTGLLDAYEAERLPITEQVSHFAMKHAFGAIAERTAVPTEITEESDAGANARRRIGEAAYRLHVQQFACAGLNFGYYYAASPVIAYDGERQPPYTMYDYTPSSVPGCRLPHLWLADGRSLYDLLGPDFTLLRFGLAAEVSALTQAAHDRGIPLALLDVPFDAPPQPYRHRLCLARPDGHVAWRGDCIGDEAEAHALLDRITGALSRAA